MNNLNSNSRTKNTLVNVATGISGKLVILVFAFAVRTVFIRKLGAEYNGLNALISNILSFLCLADIGLQNVLNFSLYSCIEENDTNKILKNLKAFKRIYGYFALVITGCGFVVIPFIPVIVKSVIPINEIYVYYMLYLINSIATYMWIYKTTLLYADQNQYVINIVTLIFKICTYSSQILVIYFWKSLFAFLIIQIFFTILQNLFLSKMTEKKYSFLKHLYEIERESIETEQKKNIIDTIKYRVSDVLLNNTDSIIISTILGTLFSGYYANYYMLFQYIEGFIYTIGTGVIASIGNLVQEKDVDTSYHNFEALMLIYAVIASVCATCFYNCTQGFIPIWIGSEYVLSDSFLFLMILVFYLNISMGAVKLYREAMGLFIKVPRMMFVAAIINITFSILLGNAIGLIGIVIATFVAKILTQYWFEPYLLFKEKLKKNMWIYHKKQIVNFCLTIISIFFSSLICSFLGSGFICIICRAIISVMICIFIYYFVYSRSTEMNEILVRMKGFMNRRSIDAT